MRKLICAIVLVMATSITIGCAGTIAPGVHTKANIGNAAAGFDVGLGEATWNSDSAAEAAAPRVGVDLNLTPLWVILGALGLGGTTLLGRKIFEKKV